MFYSMRSTIPYNNEITGRLNIANTIFLEITLASETNKKSFESYISIIWTKVTKFSRERLIQNIVSQNLNFLFVSVYEPLNLTEYIHTVYILYILLSYPSDLYFRMHVLLLCRLLCIFNHSAFNVVHNRPWHVFRFLIRFFLLFCKKKIVIFKIGYEFNQR